MEHRSHWGCVAEVRLREGIGLVNKFRAPSSDKNFNGSKLSLRIASLVHLLRGSQRAGELARDEKSRCSGAQLSTDNCDSQLPSTNFFGQLRPSGIFLCSASGCDFGGGRVRVMGLHSNDSVPAHASPPSNSFKSESGQINETGEEACPDLSTLHNLSTSEANKASNVSGASCIQKSCKVAVIGAGAAGLVAARELIREGHRVTVYEQATSVGGVWVYDPNVESDLLGVSPSRSRVHSSMYASLRTNLPREIMGFTDFPFLPRDGRDRRRFPGHKEVALYLQDFTEEYGIAQFIEFGVVVEYAGMHKEGGIIKFWKVRTRRLDESEGVKEEMFDAVVVCNGHYSEPKIAHIAGIDMWPGKQMHSHNYRCPQPFTDKTVVVIGNSASGADISKEIGEVAKEVHVSGRTWGSSVDFLKPVECALEDGTVKFTDGASTVADVILHCTGYFYSFPFLDTEGIVTEDDNCVGPLYKHVFPPILAPSLSFVGLPFKVVPFQLCELQSRWIARVLSGKVQLLSSSEMMKEVGGFYVQLQASGKPKCFTHNLATFQYEYDNWLADQSGSDHVETWRKEIYVTTSKNKRENPTTYRDVWPDEEFHKAAMLCLLNQQMMR